MTVRLVLVDDHPIVRAGLRALLAADDRLDVVGEAASADEALAVIASRHPDLVLMDLQLGDGPSGIDATRRVVAEHPDVRVLVLTTFDADTDVFGALEAGAVGYVLKDTPTAALVGAVLDAAAGHPALSPEVAARVVGRAVHTGPALTPREREILALLVTGASNRDIARRLVVSESTVKGHLANLYDKLGVDNRTAATRVARERRLVR